GNLSGSRGDRVLPTGRETHRPSLQRTASYREPQRLPITTTAECRPIFAAMSARKRNRPGEASASSGRASWVKFSAAHLRRRDFVLGDCGLAAFVHDSGTGRRRRSPAKHQKLSFSSPGSQEK